MPLITPKTDWIAGDSVGFSDMNRIEGNILYLQNENKTINGTNTFTGASTFSSTLGVTGSTTLVDLTITDIATFSSNSISIVKPVSITGGVDAGTDLLEVIETGGSTAFGGFVGQFVADSSSGLVVSSKAGSDIQRWYGGAGGTTERATLNADGRLILSGTDNTVDLVQIGSDLDISVSMGRGRVGFISGQSDNFYISHYDNFNDTDYSLKLFSNGSLRLNAKTGATVGININNSAVAAFSSTDINLFEPTTITAEQNEAMKFVGTATGDTNQAYIGFYESNGTTRQAFIGLGSGGSSDLNITSDVGSVNIGGNGLIVSSGGVKTDNEFLKTKVIDIGSWNMDGTTSITVAHGLTYDDIVNVYVTIIRDTGSLSYDLNYIGDGSHYTTATNIYLERVGGGVFDNSNFDGAQNRGYITIEYKV